MSYQNAKTADGVGGHLDFIAQDWRPLQKNTLQGFFPILLPSGMKIKDISLHQRDGKRWVALPAKPYKTSDGSTAYINLIEFEDYEAKNEFQRLTLEAVDRMERGQ